MVWSSWLDTKAPTPMVPSAPGLSSTTTGLPHLLESPSANIRAAASLALPGGNVTINLTGRSGQPAWAEKGKSRIAAKTNAAIQAVALGHHARLFRAVKISASELRELESEIISCRQIVIASVPTLSILH